MGFMGDRGAEGLPRMVKAFAKSASRNFLDRKNPTFCIQQHRQQHLYRGKAQSRAEKLRSLPRPFDPSSEKILLGRTGA